MQAEILIFQWDSYFQIPNFQLRSIHTKFTINHFALVMSMLVHSPSTCSKYIVKRIFSRRNIANFNDQLEIELWDEVYSQSDVNSAYCVFLRKFKYFLHIFPLKKVFSKKGKKSGWITQGIKVSRQRLQLLRLLKRKMSLSVHTSNYIKK